jgi:hypothetical protein
MIIKRKILKDGDIKIIKRFAFFPVRLNDEEIIWLEWYKVTKRFDVLFNRNVWDTIKIERKSND